MKGIDLRQEVFAGSGIYLPIPMKPLTKSEESLFVKAVMDLVVSELVARRCKAKKEKCDLRRDRLRMVLNQKSEESHSAP